MPTQPRPRTVVRRPRTNTGTWQAEKSHLTRTQILEATMQCLVGIGYAQTTTEKIAQQAGVSRGAMTHHFKSRAEVLAAAAQYITERRAFEYDHVIKDIHMPVADVAPTLEAMRETMAVLQKYYASPSFIALQELLRGARTDEVLKEVMAPLEVALDQKISESIVKRFPVWARMPETSEVLRDLMLTSLQGIAMDPVPYLQGERLDRLLDLLARVGMTEFERAYANQDGTDPELALAAGGMG
jgi:AcrR family transcriptional regulator